MRLAPGNKTPDIGGVGRVQFYILVDRELGKLRTTRQALHRVFAQPVKSSGREIIPKIRGSFPGFPAAVDEEKQLNARVIVDGLTQLVEESNERFIGAIIDGAIDEDG